MPLSDTCLRLHKILQNIVPVPFKACYSGCWNLQSDPKYHSAVHRFFRLSAVFGTLFGITISTVHGIVLWKDVGIEHKSTQRFFFSVASFCLSSIIAAYYLLIYVHHAEIQYLGNQILQLNYSFGGPSFKYTFIVYIHCFIAAVASPIFFASLPFTVHSNLIETFFGFSFYTKVFTSVLYYLFGVHTGVVGDCFFLVSLVSVQFVHILPNYVSDQFMFWNKNEEFRKRLKIYRICQLLTQVTNFIYGDLLFCLLTLAVFYMSCMGFQILCINHRLSFVLSNLAGFIGTMLVIMMFCKLAGELNSNALRFLYECKSLPNPDKFCRKTLTSCRCVAIRVGPLRTVKSSLALEVSDAILQTTVTFVLVG